MAKGNKKKKSMIPKLKRKIDDFLLNEEGKISRKNIAKLGISVAILGLMLDSDNPAYAEHTDGHYDGASHSSALFTTDTGGHNSTEGSHYNSHMDHADHDRSY